MHALKIEDDTDPERIVQSASEPGVPTWQEEVGEEEARTKSAAPAFFHPEFNVERLVNEKVNAAFAAAQPHYLLFEQKARFLARLEKHEKLRQMIRAAFDEVLGEPHYETSRIVQLPNPVCIKVDREAPIDYQFWGYPNEDPMIKPLQPSLENIGPCEYPLSSVERWYLPDQLEHQRVPVSTLYRYLTERDLIHRSLGWRDAWEICKIPVPLFEEVFQTKILFLPRSSIQTKYGDYMPYMATNGHALVRRWIHMNETLCIATPTAMFGEVGFRL